MFVRWDVDESKGKEENAGDPTVDGRGGLEVGIIDHSLDVAGIDFKCEFVYTDQVAFGVMECAEDTEEFAFGL